MSDLTPGPDHRAEALSAPVLGVVEHTLESVINGSALGPYRKLLWQIAGAFSGVLLATLSGHFDWITLLTGVVGGLTAVVVYPVRNADVGPWRYAKLIASFAGAAVQALVVLLIGGLVFGEISPQDWIGVLTAGLAAIGLGVTPNDPEPVLAPVRDGVADVSSLPTASR